MADETYFHIDNGQNYPGTLGITLIYVHVKPHDDQPVTVDNIKLFYTAESASSYWW